MNCGKTAIILLMAAGLLVGCAGRTQTTTTSTTVTQSTNPRQAGIDGIIQDVVGAPDGRIEADSLGRLHDWMANHTMLYHVNVENAQTHDPTQAAVESKYPLRVTVEIYQGQQIFRTFQFVPRDNRNLTQLGLN